ncbi:hypothetical protein SETIT_4G261500v2 [Setaria italica]|uniref:Uncharacterized protein n=2 Tax=Setaria TaxID=4554 RepID=A0A368QYE4_SETIT|nr:hypothetical protein SETIT_4G261500v2 [Setaria italica]TKW23147.1 hypothetical protein SEVIR_4G274400v2 [Setaria viridis]
MASPPPRKQPQHEQLRHTVGTVVCALAQVLSRVATLPCFLLPVHEQSRTQAAHEIRELRSTAGRFLHHSSKSTPQSTETSNTGKAILDAILVASVRRLYFAKPPPMSTTNLKFLKWIS